MNNEIARVQISNVDTRQRYAVVISEIDKGVMAAASRLKDGLRLTGLRMIQERRQLSIAGDRRKSIHLDHVGACGVRNNVRTDPRPEHECIVTCDRYRGSLGRRNAYHAVAIEVLVEACLKRFQRGAGSRQGAGA